MYKYHVSSHHSDFCNYYYCLGAFLNYFSAVSYSYSYSFRTGTTHTDRIKMKNHLPVMTQWLKGYLNMAACQLICPCRCHWIRQDHGRSLPTCTRGCHWYCGCGSWKYHHGYQVQCLQCINFWKLHVVMFD